MASTAAADVAWTVKRLLGSTADYLTKRRVDSPRLAAEMLIGHVLKLSRIELYTRYDDVPDDASRTKLRDLVRRAGEHEPVQYLVESGGFFGFEVKVTPAVLIPRPDTETLIDIVVRRLAGADRKGQELRVADVCTGSGIVAIALAKSLSKATIVATELSEEAAEVARANVDKLGLTDRIDVRVGDLLEGIDGDFDVIASNPPYIPTSAIASLDANVRDYEPHVALDGGDDGLDVLRRLLAGSSDRLRPGGFLATEMQHDQGDALTSLATDSGWQGVRVVRDLAGHDRVLVADRGGP
ncbi:MAG: peptide chain release factor N(5)-glutamine methyltransferase [Planctomycetota bacterium]